MPVRFLTATIVALFPLSVAASDEDIRDFDPLFMTADTFDVEIEGPFERLQRYRSEDEEVEGKFRYTSEDGSMVEFDVAFRPRGNVRRSRDVCRFPPIRVNFRKSQTDDTLFDKQDKVKLVTHCQRSTRYDQSVVSEYLAYRIFNLLTDYSYGARLIRIRYVYTDDSDVIDSYAVLIEHDDRLGKRLDGDPVELERVSVASIRPADLNIASVFQFFIGNTDFSPRATKPDEECCHNQALFSSEDGPYYTVPFDFDQAGFVNAKHAAPNPRFGISSVKTRVYRGRCVNNEYLPQTLQMFRGHRDEIETLVRVQEELTAASRRYLMAYIDDFYDTIDNPRRVERDLVNDCI